MAALFVALPGAYVLGVLVLASEVAVWVLRRQALDMHRLADKARRRALLIATLGTSAERLDIAAIEAEFSKKTRERASVIDRSDYWGDHQDGIAGLVKALQESAFWSAQLYAAAARTAWKVIGGTTALLLAIVLLGVVVFSGDVELAVARAIVVALSFLIALDLVGLALGWGTAAKEAETADRRLDRMDGADLEPVLAVFADYAIATSSVPPIPDRSYQNEHDDLERLWNDHRAGS